MKICKTIGILTVAVIFGMMTSAATYAFTGQKEYSSQAKVTIDQARSIAKKAVPGKIMSEELEKEKGGSGLRYSFDVKAKDGVVHEVGVDAKSGNVRTPYL